MNTPTRLPDRERLRWQCRRGLLELDYLLEAFLDTLYPTLSAAEQEQFIRLLACPDPDLQAWIIGEATPDDPSLLPVVERLRRIRF
jgi:antitoxin CptB